MTGTLVLNGDRYLGEIEGDYVVCCDGGYNKSHRCDCFVGDMDSVQGEISCDIVPLEVKKNFTDGEAGLEILFNKGCDSVIVYGLDGGRLDHQLMNIALLARARAMGLKVQARCNTFDAYMPLEDFKMTLPIGSIVSVVPFNDDLHISYTKGLQYPLSHFDVDKTSSRTISNVSCESQVEIGLRGAALIIINK